MKLRSLARGAFYVLLAVAPLGTRYIVQMGRIGEAEIEAGTISLFGTQLLALVVVVLSFFIRDSERQKLLPAEKTFVGAALAMLLLTVLSAVLSRDARSFINVSWLLLGIMLAATVVRLRPALGKSLWALVIGGALQSALAIGQYVAQTVGPNKWLGMAAHLSEMPGTFVVETAARRWLRAYGTTPHPNMLGAYLALAVIAALALTVMLRKRPALIAALLLAVNTLGLALTMSRSALLGLAFALAALLTATFIFRGVNVQRWRQIMTAVAVIAITLLSSLVLLYEPVAARLSGQGRLEQISIESRVSQLQDLQILLPGNRLLGVGPGLMPYALLERDPGRSPWSYQYIHNVPLLLLAEHGVLGLLVWLTLLISLGSLAVRRWMNSPSISQIAISAMLMGLLVGALFDHFLWSSWFGQLIFWSLVGLLIYSTQQKIADKSSSHPTA